MIGDIILAIFVILIYINIWRAFRLITKELNDLKDKILQVDQKANERHFLYYITKDKIRDLENRIKFLEMFSENEKARSSLPEVKGFSYKI